MKRHLFSLLMVLTVGLAVCHGAQAQYAVPATLFGSGVISAEGASFRLDATLGQPVAGWAGGSTFAVEIGFWYAIPTVATAIEAVATDAVPTRFHLEQNYPNPFNPVTVIRYALPHAGPVRLVVYDAGGRAVTTLVNRQQAADTYEVEFDASGLPSGAYFYRLEANGFAQVRSMLLLK